MAIMGNINELGNWQHTVAKMKRADGNVWVLENYEIKQTVFMYKYVILNGDRPEIWETGFNRIGDKLLLGDQAVLNDVWESYSVRFSIYYPLESPEAEVMKINGEGPQLGSWNIDGPVTMKVS